MMVSFFYIQVLGSPLRACVSTERVVINALQCEEVVVIPLRKFLLDEVVDAQLIADEKDGWLARSCSFCFLQLGHHSENTARVCGRRLF